ALAVFQAIYHLEHAIGTRRNGVLEFDRGLNVPFVVADQLQSFFDWCIAYAERHVLVAEGFVLHMNVRDSVVMLFDEGNRRGLITPDKVPQIHIRSIESGIGKCFFPNRGGYLLVSVVCNLHLMLVSKTPDPFRSVQWVGDLA